MLIETLALQSFIPNLPVQQITDEDMVGTAVVGNTQNVLYFGCSAFSTLLSAGQGVVLNSNRKLSTR